MTTILNFDQLTSTPQQLWQIRGSAIFALWLATSVRTCFHIQPVLHGCHGRSYRMAFSKQPSDLRFCLLEDRLSRSPDLVPPNSISKFCTSLVAIPHMTMDYLPEKTQYIYGLAQSLTSPWILREVLRPADSISLRPLLVLNNCKFQIGKSNNLYNAIDGQLQQISEVIVLPL